MASSFRWSVLLLAASACASVAGCSLFFPAPVPLGTLRYQSGPAQGECLLVMLPGRGDDAEAYVESGFVRLVRASGLSLDAEPVDATFGYYMRRTLLPRMAKDVIAPARARGYRHIWLLGISMGGLGALLYAQAHPETIDGLLVLSPFLGDQEVIDEIAAAGGLSAWQPPAGIDPDDYQRKLWSWLKGYTRPHPDRPALYIGWAKDDRFVRADALLGDVLPADHVFWAPGDHDWRPWRQMFEAFLGSGALPCRAGR